MQLVIGNLQDRVATLTRSLERERDERQRMSGDRDRTMQSSWRSEYWKWKDTLLQDMRSEMDERVRVAVSDALGISVDPSTADGSQPGTMQSFVHAAQQRAAQAATKAAEGALQDLERRSSTLQDQVWAQVQQVAQRGMMDLGTVREWIETQARAVHTAHLQQAKLITTVREELQTLRSTQEATERDLREARVKIEGLQATVATHERRQKDLHEGLDGAVKELSQQTERISSLQRELRTFLVQEMDVRIKAEDGACNERILRYLDQHDMHVLPALVRNHTAPGLVKVRRAQEDINGALVKALTEIKTTMELLREELQARQDRTERHVDGVHRDLESRIEELVDDLRQEVSYISRPLVVV